MIGLGSNRLTCCRRGGMSVTQAGRGGMEWLAGGRGVSPYSAQATAALQAQFPTQWPTIRDYGWQHPALVPFINEDPMLVMSLIEGLGTRWLVGDGTAYIDTGYYANQNTHAICHAIAYYNTDNPTIFGVRSDYTSHNVGSFYIGDSGAADLFIIGFGDIYKQAATGRDPIYYGEHLFDVQNGVLKVDGVSRLSVTPTNFAATRTMGIFAINDGYMNRGFMPGVARIAYLQLTDGVVSYNFVPCKNQNGEDYGMLDVVGARWYANAGSGSFTISETPAS